MDDRSSDSRAPRRLAADERSSLLIVGGDADLRLFLQGSLQRWYQLAQAATGDAAVEHLAHCPPQGLIAGRLATGDKERLISALCEADGPPVLKLWRTRPPSGWADRTLRHPFTRAALLRAVDRLVYSDELDAERDDRPRPTNVRLEAQA
jgi:hypothetical protein